MIRSKAVLTWCFRAMRREDPALRRFGNLKTTGCDQPAPPFPVFLARKARAI